MEELARTGPSLSQVKITIPSLHYHIDSPACLSYSSPITPRDPGDPLTNTFIAFPPSRH
jgi:hypothetical protein